jgi:hypothetical protein
MLTEGADVRAAVLQACVDRVPGSTAFPSGALDACLDVAGLRARDVEEVVIVGAVSAPPLRWLRGLSPLRDRVAARVPLATARARLAPLGLDRRVTILPEGEAHWFEGIASPRVAYGATAIGVRGEAPGAWGPAFNETKMYRALSTCSLPRQTTPREGGTLGVFAGPLPFGPHAGLRTVIAEVPRPMADPLPLSPLDAIHAWRQGACDRLTLGPYWLGPEDRDRA